MKLTEIKQDPLDIAAEAMGKSAFSHYMNGDMGGGGSTDVALYSVLQHLTGKSIEQVRKELNSRADGVLERLKKEQYDKYKK